MEIKLVIFVVISAFLLAALYSSSTFIAFAALKCNATPNGDQICTVTNKTGKVTVAYCYVDDDGNHVCIQVYSASTGPTGDIQNEPKIPKSDLLKEDGLLKDDNNGSNNDTKVPKDLGGLNDNDGPTINPEN